MLLDGVSYELLSENRHGFLSIRRKSCVTLPRSFSSCCRPKSYSCSAIACRSRRFFCLNQRLKAWPWGLGYNNVCCYWLPTQIQSVLLSETLKAGLCKLRIDCITVTAF